MEAENGLIKSRSEPGQEPGAPPPPDRQGWLLVVSPGVGVGSQGEARISWVMDERELVQGSQRLAQRDQGAYWR